MDLSSHDRATHLLHNGHGAKYFRKDLDEHDHWAHL